MKDSVNCHNVAHHVLSVKKHQAAAKERHKSNLKLTKYNKVCEKCFFCKSLCFCPKCVKCPQCCKCSISGGTPTKFLENMGSQGCKPKSSIHIERGLCASLQSQTSLNKGTPDSKRLCKPHQRLPLTRSCTSSDQEKGSREGQGSNLTSLFQQIVHCPKAEPKVAANLGSQYSKSVLYVKTFKMETPETIRTSLQQGEWVSSLDFSDAYFQFQFTSHPENSSGSTSRTSRTSFGLFPLACQQLPWSSLLWSKRSS